jgi:MioC protein
MTQLQILVGTTSGNTEHLADHAADLIKARLDIDIAMHYEPSFDTLDQTQPWLIFLASHGAGDYGDSMLDFYDQLTAVEAVKPFPYAVIAIGESCYDTYCSAGRDIDQRLQQLGAERIYTRLEIDMLEDDPEAAFEQWYDGWISALRSCTQS